MEKELEEWLKLHTFHFNMGEYQTKDLAEYLEINPRTIQRWLSGKGKPNDKQRARIKEYLGSQESKTDH